MGKSPGIRQVILISIDTCRADHLSCYGFDRSTTPHIDEIARQGLLYTHAYSPVPMTLPAHCSMLTGTYPVYHQVHTNREYKLEDSLVTLAEVLQEHGFRTGGIVSSFVLDRQFGIGQGFDIYEDQFKRPLDREYGVERIGGEASQMACEFIDKHQDDPFFLFLHYFDPHDAYQPPEPFATRYADDLYAGEIAYTDKCIGQVLDKLKELKLDDQTLIVIVGDHGEGLGDHGETLHGYFVYQSTVHVPFVIKPPGLNEPQTIPQAISLVDVMPTILGYLDLEVPEQVQGIDLSDYRSVEYSTDSTRMVLTESVTPMDFGCSTLLGVIDGRWSYIHSVNPELFDLTEDSGELTNLAEREAPRVRLMESQLRDRVEEWAGLESSGSRTELDPDTLKRLESLGYVGGISGRGPGDYTIAGNDPKSMIEYYEYNQQALIHMSNGQWEQARDLCEKMIARNPEISYAHTVLMQIADEENNSEDVLERGRQYLRVFPIEDLDVKSVEDFSKTKRAAQVYNLMVKAALELEKYNLVLEYGKKYLQINPDSPYILNALAQAYFYTNEVKEAFALWEKALRLKPDLTSIYVNMGTAYYQLGNLDQAVIYHNRALRLNPGLVEARNTLQVITRLKQLDQIIEQETQKLKNRPGDPVLYDRLANLMYDRGNYSQALSYWREAIRLRPDGPEAYNNLAWALVNLSDPILRDPKEALVLAEKAADLSKHNNASILETLCLVLEANGKYGAAIETAEKAIALAQNAGNRDLVEAVQQHIIRIKSKRDEVN